MVAVLVCVVARVILLLLVVYLGLGQPFISKIRHHTRLLLLLIKVMLPRYVFVALNQHRGGEVVGAGMRGVGRAGDLGLLIVMRSIFCIGLCFGNWGVMIVQFVVALQGRRLLHFITLVSAFVSSSLLILDSGLPGIVLRKLSVMVGTATFGWVCSGSWCRASGFHMATEVHDHRLRLIGIFLKRSRDHAMVGLVRKWNTQMIYLL